MASYSYLEDFLKQKMGGNNPLFSKLFGTAQRKIGMNIDANKRAVDETNAQNGFRGMGANQINQVYRTGADALEGVAGNIGQMELQDQNFAISQLLGLEQLKSQETGFWDVLGGITGSVAGGFGGGLGGKVGANWFGSSSPDWFGSSSPNEKAPQMASRAK